MRERLRTDPFVVGNHELERPKIGKAGTELLRAFHKTKKRHGLNEVEITAALAVMVGSWTHHDKRAFFKAAMETVEAEMQGCVASWKGE